MSRRSIRRILAYINNGETPLFQSPRDMLLRRAALLVLTLMTLGSGILAILHQLEPNPLLINLIVPPSNCLIFLFLLLFLFRNPDSLVPVLWAGAMTLLVSMVFVVWYVVLQATFSAEVTLIESFPPISAVPLAFIVTLFVFARPGQVLVIAIASWILISLPVLVYLAIHPVELLTPRGLEMVLTLGPIMGIVSVLMPLFQGIEAKISLLHSERTQLQILSERDPLTQLRNRRTISKIFTNHSEKRKLHLGVIMFDIDHFKKINDEHGHGVGDAVLCEIADRCLSGLRREDIFARWGGEEFLALIHEVEDAALQRIAEELRLLVSSEAIEPVGKVTASFGVTRLFPTDSLESVIQRVDEAMYEAKRGGRNKIVTNWGPSG